MKMLQNGVVFAKFSCIVWNSHLASSLSETFSERSCRVQKRIVYRGQGHVAARPSGLFPLAFDIPFGSVADPDPFNFGQPDPDPLQ